MSFARAIPDRPGLCLIVADVGVGKTTLLCAIAAELTRLGRRVLFVFGEGCREDIEDQLRAAGADLSRVVLVDAVVEHPDVELDGMLKHPAIEPHLDNIDDIMIDPLASFESDGIRRP